MLTHAIVLSLAAIATAKKSQPLISDNTTLLAARYNNNTRAFEKDMMKAFGILVLMQQEDNPDSLKSLIKAEIAGRDTPVASGLLDVNLTITDEVGRFVGNATQMQYTSIILTEYLKPVSVNSSECDFYASVGVPRTPKGSNATLDSELRSLVTNAEQQCLNHVAAWNGYTLEPIIRECWKTQNSSTRLDCLRPTIDSQTRAANRVIARLARVEFASGLPTDRDNAQAYQLDLKRQANMWIAVDFLLGPLLMMPFSFPQLRYANKLGRELKANATMQRGNVTTQ